MDHAVSTPLFKGATRPPCLMGVPLTPLIAVTGGVFLAAVWISFPIALLELPAVLALRAAARDDDQRFRQLALAFRYRVLGQKNRRARRGTVSFAPLSYGDSE